MLTMWIRTNSNPQGREVDDCVIRALAEVTGRSWRSVYLALAVSGCEACNMPDSNEVWGGYLRSLGWSRGAIPDTCPDCYTVSDFASNHIYGKYVLCGRSHVVALIDGDWYDTTDSGMMPILYYWEDTEDALY